MSLLAVMGNAAKQVGKTISANSPQIMTALGIAGMVGTLISVAVTSPKVEKKVKQIKERFEEEAEDKEEEVNTKEETKEIVKEVAPMVIGPMISFGTSIFCILKAQSIASSRLSLAIGAGEAIREEFLTYRQRTLSAIGEEAEDKIYKEVHHEIHKDRSKDKVINSLPESQEYIPSLEKTLFKDWVGRYFWSTTDDIRLAQLALVENGMSFGKQSLNDFYYEAKIEQTTIGDNYEIDFWGEKPDRLVINFKRGQCTDNGIPYIELESPEGEGFHPLYKI